MVGCAFLFLGVASCVKLSVHQTSKFASEEAKKIEAISYGRYAFEVYRGEEEKRWFELLPSCPCEEPTNSKDWYKSNAGLNRYHKGATTGYRSAATVSTLPGSAHGQQCTYDKNGKLITGGWAAGTPDTISPSAANGNDHRYLDVMTWEHLTDGGESHEGLLLYQQYWPPNPGEGCTENILP